MATILKTVAILKIPSTEEVVYTAHRAHMYVKYEPNRSKHIRVILRTKANIRSVGQLAPKFRNTRLSGDVNVTLVHVVATTHVIYRITLATSRKKHESCDA